MSGLITSAMTQKEERDSVGANGAKGPEGADGAGADRAGGADGAGATGTSPEARTALRVRPALPASAISSAPKHRQHQHLVRCYCRLSASITTVFVPITFPSTVTLTRYVPGGSAGPPNPPRPRPPPPPPPPPWAGCAAGGGAAAAVVVGGGGRSSRPAPCWPAAGGFAGGFVPAGCMDGAVAEGCSACPVPAAGAPPRPACGVPCRFQRTRFSPAVFVPSIVRTSRPVMSVMLTRTLPASAFSQ